MSDVRDGLSELLRPGEEIFVSESEADVLAIVRDVPDEVRVAVGARARQRILAEHKAQHRAAEVEGHLSEVLSGHGVTRVNAESPIAPT